MIRLMLADDHSIVREGVKQLLTLTTDISVVAEASNAGEVIQRLHKNSVDVLLLDINMPGASGVELIGEVCALRPLLRVLVFSMHNQAHIVLNALQLGASGYFSKNSDPKLLLDAIRAVSLGESFIDASIGENIALAKAFPEQKQPHTLLSPRELEIFSMLADGRNIKYIAAQLHISNKTVSTHKTNLMQKMHFASIVDLVRYATQHGLVD